MSGGVGQKIEELVLALDFDILPAVICIQH